MTAPSLADAAAEHARLAELCRRVDTLRPHGGGVYLRVEDVALLVDALRATLPEDQR